MNASPRCAVWWACFLLGLGLSSGLAQGPSLESGVRGLATRAPQGMKIDGDLTEFKEAFCTPVEYFNSNLRNRAAQFFYLWDDDAFYAGLRTLDEGMNFFANEEL